MSLSWYPISALVTKSALAPPVTRLYPFEQRQSYARTRGHVEFRINDCDFCRICAHKCPTDAIVANRKERIWAIDHSRCILCGNCVDDCKAGCITLSGQPWPSMLAADVANFRQEFVAPPKEPEPDGDDA